MKLAKKLLSVMMVLVMALTIVPTGENVKAATKAIKVRTGKVMEFVVGDTATIVLNVKNSEVKFTSTNKKIATVSAKGYVKTIRPGKATINIKYKKGKGSAKVTVIAYPKKVTNVTAEEKANTSVTVKWTPQKNVTGYQIFKSEKLNGTYKLAKTVTGATKKSVVITNLAPSKTFYFKVKAYKSVSGKKYASEFSANNKNKIPKTQRNTKQKSKTYFNSAKTYKFVWSDEFNYTDKNKIYDNWVYEIGNGPLYTNGVADDPNKKGWGNNEVQFYTEGRNIILTGSDLVIKPKYQKASEAFTPEELARVGISWDESKGQKEPEIFTSTRIKSFGKKSFKYGKIEFRCKLPSAQGTWAAAWMLGNGNRWPHTGEIDVLETYAHGGVFQKDMIPQTIHCGRFNGMPTSSGCKNAVTYVPNSTTGYHTYGIIWTESAITFTIDGKETFTYDPLRYAPVVSNAVWPYDDPFYLLLNVAIGGNLGGNVNQSQIISQAGEMYIDYVRVYQ